MGVDALNPNIPCVDDLKRPEQNLRVIIEQLRSYVPISGSGSPETVVKANKLKIYLDDDTGDVYIKKLDAIGGDKSQGWELI